jgi:aminoglycoside phosphotransferase (APT) family kinase protein
VDVRQRDGIEVDRDLIRLLLREQHPDLADRELRRAAIGWDNELWHLGDDLAVRLPHATERAGGLLRKEYRWLPALAPALPLPVPAPVRLGEPSPRFPAPWTVVCWVPGTPADRVPIRRGRHAARALAAFLRALHREAPAGAPLSSDRGVPLAAVAHGFEPAVTAVAEAMAETAGTATGTGAAGTRNEADRADSPASGAAVMSALREVWQDALAAPAWAGPPLWLHGDLHPANVVTGDGGTLTGVLDFGDMCAGDPATDLAAAWVLLPEGAAAPFFAAYATADEAMVRRARGWAVLKCLALLSIGLAGERGLPGGKPTWAPAGRAALRRVLAHDA